MLQLSLPLSPGAYQVAFQVDFDGNTGPGMKASIDTVEVLTGYCIDICEFLIMTLNPYVQFFSQGI